MKDKFTTNDSRLLFIALTANGVFSTLSGLTMLLFSGALANLIGLSEPRILLGLGVGLLLFGGSLLLHRYRNSVRKSEAYIISLMDLFWVIGSIVLVVVAPSIFSSAGIVVVLAVAAVVLTFFEMQALALWRMRAS